MGLLNFFRKEQRQEVATAESTQTDLVVNRSSASNYPQAYNLAIVESCISLIANCFVQATITPERYNRIIRKDLLANLVRTVLTTGEAVAVIEVINDQIVLVEAGNFSVDGNTTDRNKWIYQCYIPMPTAHKTIRTSGNGVIHLKYSTESSANFQGLSPLYQAQNTAGLLYSLDKKMDEEAQTSTGQILSFTMDSTEPDNLKNYQEHYQFLQKLKGGVFVERQNRERGSKQSFVGRTRLGPEFSNSSIELRDRLEANIASSFGVPIELIIADGEGTATREAFRRFILTTVQPLAIRAAEEFSDKLEDNIEFKFERLRSADLQGIGRAVKSLVNSGIALDQALEMSGLN